MTYQRFGVQSKPLTEEPVISNEDSGVVSEG
jgi:hypothetical protein